MVAQTRTFFPGGCAPSPVPRNWTGVDNFSVAGKGDEPSLTVFTVGGSILAIVSPKRLRVSRFASAERDRRGLAALPDFIALPRDAEGRPIIPRSRVTALVEAQDAWHKEFGTIDGVASSIVRGLLVMPKIATPSQQRAFKNHPSFDGDPAAQRALGPVVAKWLAQGVLEYVLG